MPSDARPVRLSIAGLVVVVVTAALAPAAAWAQEPNAFAGDFVNEAYFFAAAQNQLATFPVSTSAGAFTYVFNPNTRTFSRRTNTFGPPFIERAATLGRAHMFSAGMSVERVTFVSLDGRRLSDAPFYVRTRYPDGRVTLESGALRLSAVTVAAFGTFSVTPDVDVTIVAPASTISFQGTSGGTRGPLQKSTGLGDIQARAKWGFWRSSRVALSAEYGLRLPTGRGGNGIGIPHGAGSAQQKLSALASAGGGAVQAHLNAGYAFRVASKSPGDSVQGPFANFGGAPSKGAASDEASFGAGAEWAPHQRVTLSADYVGRWLRDNIRFEERTDDRFGYPGAPPFGYLVDSINPVAANLYLAIGSVGAKYQVVARLLAAWHVVFPLSSGGLRPGVSSVIGWEYGF